MKIEQFLGGAISTSGTIACHALLDDGSVIGLGLTYSRIPKIKAERLVFIGSGNATKPSACTLPRGSREEQDVIEAIQDYFDRSCGILRREDLLKAAPSTLSKRDGADLMAVILMREILDR